MFLSVGVDPVRPGGGVHRSAPVPQRATAPRRPIWGAAWPALTVENDPPDARSNYLVVWDGPDGDETQIDHDGLGVDLLGSCAPGTAHFGLYQTFLDRRAAYEITVYSDAQT